MVEHLPVSSQVSVGFEEQVAPSCDYATTSPSPGRRAFAS